uniref:HYLS1_C domain-containing protein n=1 Tax=Rhabditophanes sp. KR3021 TaxID=114890 RepID=A0AC35UHS7_9BILA
MAVISQYTIEEVKSVLDDMGYVMDSPLLRDFIDAINENEENCFREHAEGGLFSDCKINEVDFLSDRNPFNSFKNAKTNKDIFKTPSKLSLSRNDNYKSYTPLHSSTTNLLLGRGQETLTKIYSEIEKCDRLLLQLTCDDDDFVELEKSMVTMDGEEYDDESNPVTYRQVIAENKAIRMKNEMSPCMRYKGQSEVPGRLDYRHDPVKKYHLYKKEWDKRPAPGEQKRLALRWKIREMMLKKDIPVYKKVHNKVAPRREEWRK